MAQMVSKANVVYVNEGLANMRKGPGMHLK